MESHTVTRTGDPAALLYGRRRFGSVCAVGGREGRAPVRRLRVVVLLQFPGLFGAAQLVVAQHVGPRGLHFGDFDEGGKVVNMRASVRGVERHRFGAIHYVRGGCDH
jgi:hypothetical protein